MLAECGGGLSSANVRIGDEFTRVDVEERQNESGKLDSSELLSIGIGNRWFAGKDTFSKEGGQILVQSMLKSGIPGKSMKPLPKSSGRSHSSGSEFAPVIEFSPLKSVKSKMLSSSVCAWSSVS